MKKILYIASLVVALIAGEVFGYGIRRNAIVTAAPEPTYTELSGWQVLKLAIAKTESEFEPWAVGKCNDIGLLQITPIYVSEVNRIDSTASFSHSDAFSIEKSLMMFDIYQNAKNPEHDIEKAIRLHNPGGDTIGYAERVMRNYRYILSMESARKQVVLVGSE